MAGAEDREVWERRPFPLERLVRDARPSASQFRIVMRKTSRASGPPGPLNSARTIEIRRGAVTSRKGTGRIPVALIELLANNYFHHSNFSNFLASLLLSNSGYSHQAL
jgi:hypothetical protein